MVTSTTNSNIIWTANDPLGKTIQLKESTFNEHIINENNRTEFIGKENLLKQIIERPRFILPDKTYKDSRYVYCDLQYMDTLNGVFFIDVVVDYSTYPNDLVTAISCRTIPRLETRRIIYDSKNKI